MGMTIRLALAALALALAVLGPLAAQAVTLTWATDAKRSGGGPADAKPVAPDARAGSSRPLASGRGGVALFDIVGAFSGPAFIREAGWPGAASSGGYDRRSADICVSPARMGVAGFGTLLKLGDAGGFLAPRGTRIELSSGLYRTLAGVDTSRRWRSEGFRVDAAGVSQVAAIPLPMTASLMAAGIFGLAIVGRRRQSVVQSIDGTT